MLQIPDILTPVMSEHVRGILAAAFLAGVLLCRVTQPPESWRRVNASMTIEQLRIQLGKPRMESANEMRWLEQRLVGNWELTVNFDEESPKAFQKHFRLFNKLEE